MKDKKRKFFKDTNLENDDLDKINEELTTFLESENTANEEEAEKTRYRTTIDLLKFFMRDVMKQPIKHECPDDCCPKCLIDFGVKDNKKYNLDIYLCQKGYDHDEGSCHGIPSHAYKGSYYCPISKLAKPNYALTVNHSFQMQGLEGGYKENFDHIDKINQENFSSIVTHSESLAREEKTQQMESLVKYNQNHVVKSMQFKNRFGKSRKKRKGQERASCNITIRKKNKVLTSNLIDTIKISLININDVIERFKMRHEKSLSPSDTEIIKNCEIIISHLLPGSEHRYQRNIQYIQSEAQKRIKIIKQLFNQKSTANNRVEAGINFFKIMEILYIPTNYGIPLLIYPSQNYDELYEYFETALMIKQWSNIGKIAFSNIEIAVTALIILKDGFEYMDRKIIHKQKWFAHPFFILPNKLARDKSVSSIEFTNSREKFEMLVEEIVRIHGIETLLFENSNKHGYKIAYKNE